MTARTLSVAGLLALAPAAAAQILLGPEIQVNTFTTGDQTRPAVAANVSGTFVVVWDSLGQDGSGQGVFARFHDGGGTPIGGAEFRVNSWTTGDQRTARIAATASGDFIVVWESWGQDGPAGAIFARRYDASGTPLGPEFQVSATTTRSQGIPSVAPDADGNFVIAWEGVSGDGSSYGVKARRYDAAGLPLGGEFPVNTFTTDAQFRASVVSSDGGSFMVAWQSYGQGDVLAQRYDALGAPAGTEFTLNTYTTGIQSFPAIASDGDGNFTAVWTSALLDGSGDGVFGQRFAASGATIGGEFAVNTYTTGQQTRSAIAMDPRRRFAVVWASDGQDGNAAGIFARHFEASGTSESPGFPLNTYTTGNQMRPAAAVDGSGRYVAVWVGAGQDGDGFGVFAQRFVPDLIFRDGFEDGTMGEWSAASTDGGDLNVSAVAGLKFTTAGLRGVVDDTAGLYVEDTSPIDEDRYRARFYLDPNGFDPGEAQNRFRTRVFIVFEENPNRRLAAIVLRRLAGQYSLMGRARRDDDSQHNTGFFPISDDPHFVELAWRRASGPDANDGAFELSIDGAPVHTTKTLDSSISRVDFVRLGALSVKAGATGTLYWDEFESRRQGAIGP